MLCFPRNMTMGNDQSGERDSFRNIETYARLKMDELGLADWQFGWDRAKEGWAYAACWKKALRFPSTSSAPTWRPLMKSVTRFCMRSPTPWRGPATENAPTDRDGNKFAEK